MGELDDNSYQKWSSENKAFVMPVVGFAGFTAALGFMAGTLFDANPGFKRIVLSFFTSMLVIAMVTLLIFAMNTPLIKKTYPRLDHLICKVANLLSQNSSQLVKQNRPERIILIRHGQSVGNIDRRIYQSVADNKLSITAHGHAQAVSAGKELKELIGDENTLFFVSPYMRTKQTLWGILVGGNFDPKSYSVREDPRLREQEFGNYQNPEDQERVALERRAVGRFWYRIPDGESGADVYDRITSFMQTLYREMDAFRPKKERLSNVVIISHGLAIRLFCMRYLHWSVDEFEQVWNPRNCERWVLEKNGAGRFELTTQLRIGRNKEHSMPMSMRVPHREIGLDLEVYLKSVREQTFTSPILSGSAKEVSEMAAQETSEMSSMKSMQIKALADHEALTKSMHSTDDITLEEQLEEESEEEPEESVFTLTKNSRESRHPRLDYSKSAP